MPRLSLTNIAVPYPAHARGGVRSAAAAATQRPPARLPFAVAPSAWSVGSPTSAPCSWRLAGNPHRHCLRASRFAPGQLGWGQRGGRDAVCCAVASSDVGCAASPVWAGAGRHVATEARGVFRRRLPRCWSPQPPLHGGHCKYHCAPLYETICNYISNCVGPSMLLASPSPRYSHALGHLAHPAIAARSRSTCCPTRGFPPPFSSRSLHLGTPGSSDRLLVAPSVALSP